MDQERPANPEEGIVQVIDMIAPLILGFMAGAAAFLVFRPESTDERDTTRFLESLGDEQLDVVAEILDDEQMTLFGHMLERRAISAPMQADLEADAGKVH